MGDNFKKIVRVIGNTMKAAILPMLPWILIVVGVIVVFAGMEYIITLDTGTKKEDDWSNTPFGASNYTNNVNINTDGSISTGMTAQEVWDELIENGSNIKQYLDSPEQLQKLMNAQLVTQYPDTRPDTTKEIDWENMDADNLQGVVKFIRADSSGNKKNMTYADPETFQSYIDDYNNTGSEQARENALSHFTIATKKSNSNSTGNSTGDVKVDSLDNILFIGDSLTDGLANSNIIQNATFKAEIGVSPSYWADRINELPTDGIDGVCVLLGINGLTSDSSLPNTVEDMKELIDKLSAKYQGKPIYIQKVFPLTHDSSYHIEKENIDSYNTQIQEYCNTKQGVSFIDTTQGYIESDGYLNPSKAEPDGLHFKDFQTWANNIENAIVSKTDNSSNTQNNTTNNVSSDELFWPTDLTDITSPYNEDRNGEPHQAIDIKTYNGDPNVGNPVYACEEGTVKYARKSNSAGLWIVIDHGNGFTSEYMHNSSLEVTEGEKVQKGQRIALSGNTGQSQGVHLHFEINKDEKPVDPLSFKYSNGQGYGTGGFGNYSTPVSGDSNNNLTTETYVKVATWTETENIEDYEDPSLEDKHETYHSMTTQDIPYQNMTEGYTMPFEFLWALLVVGNDKDFVLALADLVYGSDIEITIHDNLRIDTKEEVYTYEKHFDVKATVNLTTKYKEKSEEENEEDDAEDDEEKSYSKSIDVEGSYLENKYKATFTEINRTNTLDVQLTKANVWIVDYERESNYDGPKEETQVPDGVQKLGDVNDDGEPFKDNEDKIGAVDTAKGLIETEIREKYDVESIGESTVNSIESTYYKKIKNLLKTVTNTTETSKYTLSPATITEKTDKEGKNGENFVTLFNNNEYLKNQGNILSASGWLFEILERNDSTKDMVDLTKYLLYKATNQSYGVTKYDFSIYNPDNFASVEGIYGGTPQEKVWFALRNLGYSEIVVAGAMGNIDYESGGFDPTLIENGGSGEGIGLIQWSWGRRDQLEAYAASKGVSWTDVDTQIEFLVAEISGKGKAASHATQRKSGYIIEEHIVSTHDDWANATNIDDATLHFMRFFESPQSKASLGERQRRAQMYYNEFHGRTMPSGGSSQSSNGDGYTQTYTSSKGRTYKEYKQFLGSYKNDIYHPYGETISSSGCSITSIAIILSGYGVNVDPGDLANHNYLQEHIRSHGVSCDGPTSADKTRLMSGRPALVGISGTLKVEGNSKYYGGHFVAILDARGTDEVYVSDVGSSVIGGWAKVEDIISIATSVTYITED